MKKSGKIFPERVANFVLAERAPASLKTMGLVEPPGARGGKRRRGLVGIATYLWYASVRDTCSQTALISRAYMLRGMFPAIRVRGVAALVFDRDEFSSLLQKGRLSKTST